MATSSRYEGSETIGVDLQVIGDGIAFCFLMKQEVQSDESDWRSALRHSELKAVLIEIQLRVTLKCRLISFKCRSQQEELAAAAKQTRSL